jgi:soluble lytic murein transglycosylase-like protein
MTRLAAMLLLLAACAGARAEIWGYVDGAGVAHLASAPVDARYRPLIHPAPVPGVPGKADRTGGLLTWLEIAPEVRVLRPWLREAAASHGVDASLLLALITVESGFDAAAVSPRGALGLMQIMPVSGERYATAAERQVPVAQRLRDPRTNIHTGARMLADLQRRFGRIDAALAAWNAGEGRVRRAGGTLPRIAETEAHVQMVLELYWALLQRDQARRASSLKVVADR